MKKIMLLGGNYFQSTAVKAAKELGHYVINVDYLPNNPAHKFADEYHNISTLDRDRVLELAKALKIDGIVSYASDISAPTAAYVAETMGLPTNPLSSVEILTRKDLMRSFLNKHGFNVPKSSSFDNFEAFRKQIPGFSFPLMIKPVDSAGSKGVSRVDKLADLETAFNEAMKFSITKIIIVEEYIQRDGYQIAGDGFLVDGKLVFLGIGNEHFDKLCNPFVPIGESFPSNLSYERREKAKKEIQRLTSLLKMRRGAINLDFMFDKEGKLYIIEVGPRNGGNLITDAIKAGCGTDLAKFTITSALGEDCSSLAQEEYHDFVSSYIIHSIKDGIYDGLDINPKISKNLLLLDIFVSKGDTVYRFNNGGLGLGAALLRFDSGEEMRHKIDNMERFIKVNLLQ